MNRKLLATFLLAAATRYEASASDVALSTDSANNADGMASAIDALRFELERLRWESAQLKAENEALRESRSGAASIEESNDETVLAPSEVVDEPAKKTAEEVSEVSSHFDIAVFANKTFLDTGNVDGVAMDDLTQKPPDEHRNAGLKQNSSNIFSLLQSKAPWAERKTQNAPPDKHRNAGLKQNSSKIFSLLQSKAPWAEQKEATVETEDTPEEAAASVADSIGSLSRAPTVANAPTISPASSYSMGSLSRAPAVAKAPTVSPPPSPNRGCDNIAERAKKNANTKSLNVNISSGKLAKKNRRQQKKGRPDSRERPERLSPPEKKSSEQPKNQDLSALLGENARSKTERDGSADKGRASYFDTVIVLSAAFVFGLGVKKGMHRSVVGPQIQTSRTAQQSDHDEAYDYMYCKMS